MKTLEKHHIPSKINPEAASETPHGIMIRNICFGLLCLLVVLMSIKQITDDDVFWHLATGRWIVEHHTVPGQDVFGYVTQGARWIPFEWGWDVLTFLLYSINNSYTFLQLLPAVVWLGIILLQIGTMRALNISPLLAILTLLLVVLASVFSIQTRPYIMSLLGYSAVMYLYTTDRFTRSGSSRRISLLPLVFLLWANMHPGVLGGILLLGALLASEIIQLLLEKFHLGVTRPLARPVTSRSVVTLLIVSVLSVLALLLNPHGFSTYEYVYQHTNLNLLRMVNEWLSPLNDLDTRVVWFYEALLVLGVAGVVYAIRKREAWTGILYLCFAYYSIRAVRFIPDFAVVTAAGTALGLQSILWRLRASWRRVIEGRTALLVLGGVIIYLTIGSVDGSLFYRLHYNRHFGFGVDPNCFSAPLIAFMKENKITGRPFNSNEIGGQLVWEFPGERNFIDSRNLNDSIWNEYYSIQNMSPGFEEKLSSHGVDYIVLEIYGLIASPMIMDGTLIPYCSVNRDQWKLVYWDDRSFLYLKNVPKFKEVIEKNEYKILHPYLYAFAHSEFDSLLRADSQRLRTELLRKLHEEPDGVLTRTLLRYASQVYRTQ